MVTKALLQKHTKNALKRMDDLKKTIKYQQKGNIVFNLTTKVASPATDSEKTFYGYLVNYKTEEVLAGIASPEDQRLIIERQKIDFTPETDDELSYDGGQTWWKVEQIKDEISQSLYILRIARR